MDEFDFAYDEDNFDIGEDFYQDDLLEYENEQVFQDHEGADW
jgi:hypothetical protein